MAKRRAPPDDPKEVDSKVRITDFGGIACGLDLHDTDPGESYYQVNVVPFHPGELRARRGFVVCQFESGPTAVLVAPPLVRYAEAASSLWMHSDARRGREIEVSVWENLVVTAHQPVSNFHPVKAFGRVVLTSTASAYRGNLTHLYVSAGSYSLDGDFLVVSAAGHAGQNQMSAVVGVYPVGASPVSGVSNIMSVNSGVYHGS